MSTKPGIFSSICSLELYTSIFEEENALHNLEKFTSINGPTFYNLPVNKSIVVLQKEEWTVPEYSIRGNIKVKNFYANKKINWKLMKLKV